MTAWPWVLGRPLSGGAALDPSPSSCARRLETVDFLFHGKGGEEVSLGRSGLSPRLDPLYASMDRACRPEANSAASASLIRRCLASRESPANFGARMRI